MMSTEEVRSWIGKYFLFTLSAIGGYIYLFSETPLLPLNRAEALAAGETIIPVLLGQLAIIYRWYFSGDATDRVGELRVPAWLVKGPPLISITLIVMSILSMVIANYSESYWAPDPESFRRIVVFVVSVLNVTTVIVITRYFGEIEPPQSEEGAEKSG